MPTIVLCPAQPESPVGEPDTAQYCSGISGRATVPGRFCWPTVTVVITVIRQDNGPLGGDRHPNAPGFHPLSSVYFWRLLYLREKALGGRDITSGIAVRELSPSGLAQAHLWAGAPRTLVYLLRGRVGLVSHGGWPLAHLSSTRTLGSCLFAQHFALHQHRWPAWPCRGFGRAEAGHTIAP